MDINQAREEALKLVQDSGFMMLGSVDEDGFPNIKATFKYVHDGLKRFLIGTNTSAQRTGRYQQYPKASAYFVHYKPSMGLQLIGEMEVSQDPALKRLLWKDGYEIYYPLGVDDPDYSILIFTARKARYYHALQTTEFDICN